MDNKKIIEIKKLFHDYEAKDIQAVCNCDYDELAQEIVKLFALTLSVCLVRKISTTDN